jgi:MarR family 2-MHQ and catechol resistance regulon transcriptional repressor
MRRKNGKTMTIEKKMTDKLTEDKLRMSTFIALLRFSDVLARYSSVEFTKHDSSAARTMLMDGLYLNGGSLSPTELAKYMFRTNHSITSMVDTLEKQELVRREPNPLDRRSIKITLTPQGWDLMERMLPATYDISKRALECLDDEEAENLKETLKRISKHLLEQIADQDEEQD